MCNDMITATISNMIYYGNHSSHANDCSQNYLSVSQSQQVEFLITFPRFALHINNRLKDGIILGGNSKEGSNSKPPELCAIWLKLQNLKHVKEAKKSFIRSELVHSLVWLCSLSFLAASNLVLTRSDAEAL